MRYIYILVISFFACRNSETIQDDPRALEPSSGTVAVTNRYLDFFDSVGRQVYVNGQKVDVNEKYQSPKKPGITIKPQREGLAKPRQPFEVDVTNAIHPGENVVALRVDHSTITELSLGGILRPVLLIAKPE